MAIGRLYFDPSVLQSDTGWWLERTDDGRQGIFPYRVELVESVKAVSPQTVLDRINKARASFKAPIPTSG